MEYRRKFFLLIFIMAFISLIVVGATITLLYRTSFAEQKERLLVTVQSQARLIESIARFSAKHSKENHAGGAEAAALGQIIEAHGQYEGFGVTGELVLAKRDGDQIVFLLSHRHLDFDNPMPLPFDSVLAEPMRRAVSGMSRIVRKEGASG